MRNEFPRSAFLHLSPLTWVMFFCFPVEWMNLKCRRQMGGLWTFIERLITNGWLGTTVPNSHGRGPLYSHQRYRHPVQSVEMGSHPRLHGCPQTFIEWRLSFSDKRQDVTSRLIFISRVRSFLVTFRFGKELSLKFWCDSNISLFFFLLPLPWIRVSPIRFNHSFILFF